MGLHDNDGKGYRTIPDLIKAIHAVTDLFSAKEIRSAIAEMHKERYVFNDLPSKESATLIVCDKSRKSGYYFGLEGVQS